MYRRNSFFVKIFIPVIAVMLLQISIIGVVLIVNGTVETLEDAEIATLSRYTENRGSSLEQMMIYNWSNLERLELNVTNSITSYMRQNGLTIDEALGDYTHEINMLNGMSQYLIDALRIGASTGVFMMFLDKDGFIDEAQTRNGLYYRDFDPLSNPADNTDILFLKGYIDIARKDLIQLDSLWSETFTFDPADEDLWRGFANPQIAFAHYPEASTVNLSYWNGPHLQNPQSMLDSNWCITYTRPVIINGRLAALIGTEVQVTHLEKYFPANDFDINSQSGYMLIVYDVEQNARKRGRILHTTGSYIRRMLGAGNVIDLLPTDRDNVYAIPESSIGKESHAALSPLRLYNTNAPFYHEQWGLIALGTDEILFTTSRSVTIGIIISSVLSFAIGAVVLAITVRRASRPLVALAGQIERSGHGGRIEEAFTSDANIHEINLLCETLNMTVIRRNAAEQLVRKERQRYLIALESAADTFMEYDAGSDCFMLYYFTDSNDLMSKTIEHFTSAVNAGEFCHPDDAPVILGFFRNAQAGTVEIRAKTTVFSHIRQEQDDNGYYWFLIKASISHDNEGNVSNIIGTAKEITADKLSEFAQREATRRDPTTRSYNRDYGMNLVRERLAAAHHANAPDYLMFVVHIKNFDELESFYGRVFSGFVMLLLSRGFSGFLEEKDIIVRLSNDRYLIYFDHIDGETAEKKAQFIRDKVDKLYTGENANIRLSVDIFFTRSLNDVFDTAYNDKPINSTVELNKDNIVSAVFDFFERATDVRSSINILLGVLGSIYDFARIIIYSFDPGFCANQIEYQWMREGLPAIPVGLEKTSYPELAAFEELLDKNGTVLYTSGGRAEEDEDMFKLVNVGGTQVRGGDYAQSIYCCSMREGAAHTGRVLFVPGDRRKEWNEKERHDLCDIVKIISANISVEKSRSASRAKSEFLSRISHEIRTPMNAILGMTDIARSAIGDKQKLEESLKQINYSAHHLLTLINDVLEMSRIESGKLKIDSHPFTLDGLIDGVDTLMRSPIEGNGITFTIIRNYTQASVVGDENRLRQVLINLLGNANKFTAKGGKISLTVKQSKTKAKARTGTKRNMGLETGEYTFTVADTGIGVNPNEQKVIFEPFAQAASAQSSKQQHGTGLGLAISDSIVSAMGGKIKLDSRPGKGSKFFFTLTLQLWESEPSQDGQSGDAADFTGYFKGKRALLVDDIKTNIIVAAFVLEQAGLEIEQAYDGQQALDMFTSSQPGYYDIIFMDVKMPVMDGLEATRKIRGSTRPDSRNIPIVAMTADAYEEDIKKSIEAGMNGHIAKPIVKEQIYEMMMEVLSVRS